MLKSVPSITLFFLILSFLSSKDISANTKYVGAEGCKCHKSEISDWEFSHHAKSFDLLKPGKRKSRKKKAHLDPYKDYTEDEKCIECHVTGFRKEGGFIDIDSTPQMAGVGCESCHGPGSEYRILHKNKSLDFSHLEAKKLGALYGSVDPSVCNKCHQHKNNPFKPEINKKYRFNHKKALKQVMSFHDYYELEGEH